MTAVRFRIRYLHGFGSGKDSWKGIQLRDALARVGVGVELIDLNVPSFEKQTYSAILRHLDDVDASTPKSQSVALVGSSMGGYLAARWAELNPDRVDRLFLLCPGFDLAARWPLYFGDELMRRWEQDGAIEVEDAAGDKKMLHWGFVVDARKHTDYPEVRCPTRILHGRQDDVVPIRLSRRFVENRPHARLIEVDDDHRLHGSVSRISSEVCEFLGLPGR